MNYIVRETCSEMRAIARKALRGNWKKITIVMAMYYLLSITLPQLIDQLIPGATMSYYNENLGETVSLPVVSTLYTIFLTGAFEVGIASFCIYFFRRRELHAVHLFDGFERFGKLLFWYYW